MDAVIIIETDGFCHITHPTRPHVYNKIRVSVRPSSKISLRQKIPRFLRELVVEESKTFPNTTHVKQMKRIIEYVIKQVEKGVFKIKYGTHNIFCEIEISSYDLIV